MAQPKPVIAPSLTPSYAIVSRFGWWGGFGEVGDINVGWVGPYECTLFDSPQSAMTVLEDLRRYAGELLALQLVTVVTDRRDRQ